MPLPAAYWARLGVLILTACVCRRWPRLALWAAFSADCEVWRGLLAPFPSTPDVIVVDALLFSAPSALLAVACGGGSILSISTGFVPLFALAGGELVSELRPKMLAFGVVLIQGIAAVSGIAAESDGPRSWERRASVVLAGTAVLSAFFLRDWNHVAAAGCAAHVFVLLAYLRHGRREDRGDLDRLPGAPVDERAPSAEDEPRSEPVEQTEDRPEARREDPRGDDRAEHDQPAG